MQRSIDIGTGLYGGGLYVARWTMVDGHPRCVQAPLILADTDEGEIGARMAINRAIAALVAPAEQFEAAAVLQAGVAPQQWVIQTDEDGLAALVENPAWLAWVAAGVTVAAAGPTLLHLIRTRADALDEDEAGFELTLPELPLFDARTETADLLDGAWVVRALTEGELAAHPLRPAPFMAKMAFGKLIITTLGSSLGGSVLSMFGGVLTLADNVDWADVFEFIDGDLSRPGYAKQLLADEVVTPAQVAALRDGWVRACAA